MTDRPSVDPIAEFYDAHPYPPPVDDLDDEIASSEDDRQRRVEHARRWPSLPFRDDHAILVAGCGTYQAARYGIRHPAARVVGIDVSETAIEETRRLVRHHDLENVELHHLAVEDAGVLGHVFDHIVCTGVLHHLDDPEVGLRALRDALAPRGVIDLMVYATYGRAGVAMLQDYCRRLGVDPTAREVADLVAMLRELPAGHPLGDLLRNSPDFADDGAIADALLHPRDRSYTVPDLFDLLDRSGMRFRRWLRQAPYQPLCGAMSETPHAARVADLDLRGQYAAMELFRGTIRRHNAIIVRDDAPLPDPPLAWAGDRWRAYVPIVPASVVTVEERLPPGVAAALINRAHTDRDLVCFVDAAERRAFESVDGHTPFGEIEGARAELLQRLWWHDLVMIDASAAR